MTFLTAPGRILFITSILLTALCINLSSQENFDAVHSRIVRVNPEKGQKIFISTRPFGARISINGEELTGRTPQFIDLPLPGNSTVEIYMTGFERVVLPLETSPGSITIIEGLLKKTGGIIFFPEETGLQPPGGYSFEPGLYELGRYENQMDFTPVYPNQNWIDGLNIAIPIVTVFTGGMMIAEALSPRSNGRISPFTITALAIDLLMAGADIGLHVHRAKWRKTWETDPAEATPLWVEDDYQLAESSLASGELLQARYLFNRFAMIYPLNEQTPEALYRSARLAYMQGDFEACFGRLKLLRKDYPIPGLWDRGWRLAADLYFKANQLEEGLAALEMIYGLEDPVDLESAAFRKASVLTDSAVETGDTKRAVDAWNLLIKTWPESVLIDEYRALRDSQP